MIRTLLASTVLLLAPSVLEAQLQERGGRCIEGRCHAWSVGTVRFPDGSTTTARWTNRSSAGTDTHRSAVGVGRIVYSEGNVYQGMLDGEGPDGYGILREEGGDVYMGRFVDGRRDGLVYHYSASGDVAREEYRNGERVRRCEAAAGRELLAALLRLNDHVFEIGGDQSFHTLSEGGRPLMNVVADRNGRESRFLLDWGEVDVGPVRILPTGIGYFEVTCPGERKCMRSGSANGYDARRTMLTAPADSISAVRDLYLRIHDLGSRSGRSRHSS